MQIGSPRGKEACKEVLHRVLVRKGLLTNEEVLEEVKAVRRELEGEKHG